MFQIAGKDRSNLSDAFKPCGGLEKPSQRLRASAMSFDLPGMWDTSKVIPDEATKRLNFSRNKANGMVVVKSLFDTDSAPELSDNAGTRKAIR